MARRFTYANVTSTLALCIAVGGGSAYAGATLAKNSVKAPQIAAGAVGSSEIRNGSVTLKDLGKDVLGTSGASGAAGGAGAPGNSGLRGTEGPAGPQGPAGPAGADLSFNGTRLGKMVRYTPTGTNASNSTKIPLGRIGALSVEGTCFDPPNGTSAGVAITLRNDAGAPAVPVFGAPSNQYSVLSGGSVVLQNFDPAIPGMRQWSATVVDASGDTYDFRGLVIEQAPNANPTVLPPAGQACGITEASIERVTR
jgi:hypothetical protein